MPPISQDEILQQVKLSCQMPALVRAIAERKIVSQKAQELELTVETAELQKAADSFRLKNNLVTAQETIDWLECHALSLDDLEALVYHTVLSTKLADRLFADRVKPYFTERQLDYTQIVLYEVVLSDFDLAMELFYALQEGEITFAEIAQQYAQELEMRRRGGYRGLVTRKDLKPELSAAIFAAKPPQLLKPIAVGKQVYLVWVEAIVSPALTETLRSQILTELFSGWLKQQVKAAAPTLDSTLSPKIVP
ncbi:peptidylprolyl isomerase [Altericista sp. CCNU0014]|uniref:peptidylprolyl isomerase n=1 Tax=Altericista sp. CCNU0014 TaxID=3082949 RepID=UPI0038506CDA